MAQKPLHELSTEELNRQKSLFKGILIAYAIIEALLLALSIYQLITKGKLTTIAIPIALLPVMMVLVSSMKKIDAELKQRGQ